MRTSRTGTGRVAAGLLSAVAVAWTALPAGAQEAEVHRIAGVRVAVYNLAGAAEIVAGSGSEVVVRVTPRGADAGALEVAVDEIEGRPALRVLYPDDRIVYPGMGRGSTTTQRVRSDGTFGGGGGDRVTVRGRGDGLEAWADLRIEVPAGRFLELSVAAGATTATDLDADLSLDVGSGGARVSGIRGRLSLDTGSGDLFVAGVDGPTSVDTGSGDVEVTDVEGDATVDTGSGSVRIEGVRGGSIRVDTGSGQVRGSDLTAGSVRIDTGSGSIDVRRVDAAEVELDTGSGGVDVDLTRDVDRLVVDTGTGSVTVRVPEDLGAEIDVETGSGGIDMDLPVQLRTMSRNRLRGTVGDGAGSIRIDTGSGSVRIVRR